MSELLASDTVNLFSSHLWQLHLQADLEQGFNQALLGLKAALCCWLTSVAIVVLWDRELFHQESKFLRDFQSEFQSDQTMILGLMAKADISGQPITSTECTQQCHGIVSDFF